MSDLNVIAAILYKSFVKSRIFCVMASDERNFRSAYYEKVGFKNVEEKKSLEILLKDRVLDPAKLRQFCLRYTVPAGYRNAVWKVLLGVVPVHQSSYDFVMEQRRDECNDTVQALQVMRLIDANTSKPQLLYALWLIQNRSWRQIYTMKMTDPFPLIGKSLIHYFDDQTDLYWITKNFYIHIQKFKPEIPKLIEATVSLLEKEDNVLYKHLNDTGILPILPLEYWFNCCFAGLLDDKVLAKIWDKLCGGSYKILVFVVVVLLMNQRHYLLESTKDGILKCFSNLSEETSEIIANGGIEMWQKHGYPLTVYDKPKPKDLKD